MSTIAAALLFAAPAPTATPTDALLTAEEALENYRATFEPAGTPRCRLSDGTDEIVVCGRRETHRLPLPVERDPGLPIRGEPTSAASLMPKCHMACPPAFGVNVLEAI